MILHRYEQGRSMYNNWDKLAWYNSAEWFVRTSLFGLIRNNLEQFGTILQMRIESAEFTNELVTTNYNFPVASLLKGRCDAHRLPHAKNDSDDVSGLKNSTRLPGRTSAGHPRAVRSSRTGIFRRAPKFSNLARGEGETGEGLSRPACVPVIFSYVLYLSRRVHTLVLVTRSWRASARTNKIFRVNEVRDAAPPGEPLISTSHTWIQLRRTSIRESSPRPFFFLSPVFPPVYFRACVRMRVHVRARESACWVNVRVRSSRVTYDATH